MQDEAAPKHAAVTEHKREQPDDPLGTGLVGECRAEVCEIDLRLGPGGVSKRTSNSGTAAGLMSRRNSVKIV